MSERVRGSATLSSAFVVVALGVLSASAQLNPTVKVLPKPQTQVPPECEQGLAPAVPRVIVAEVAEEAKPARAVPPPSLDLKTQLRTVQLAAERGDRDAFKAALADARDAVSAFPRGGERNAANDVVSGYSDLERLWDYEFTSPTGAFFDSSTDFVAMMRRYPMYSATIADQTLTVGGKTLYPSVETRKFLVTEAARRLNSLGVRTPTRIVETPPPPVPAPQPRIVEQPVPRRVPEKPAVRKTERTTPSPRPVQHHATHKAPRKPAKTATKPATKTATKPAAKKAAKPPVKVAEARPPSPKPRAAEPQPQPQPQPVPQPKAAPPPMPVATPKPAPAPVPVPQQPQPQPQPVAPPTVTETATATSATTASTPAMPTDTMVATTTAAPPDTTATAATTTTAPKENQPATGGRMNLLFAIILIIVGIGVLIILFRASD